MSLAIDLGILLICVLTVIVDTKRGFIKSFMHLASTVVALLLGYAFTPWLGGILREKLVLSGITSGISSTLKSLVSSGDGTYNLENLFSNSVFSEIAQRYGVSSESLRDYITGQTTADGGAVDSLSAAIADPVATVLANVLAFLGIFIGALLVLRLLTWALDTVFHLPVLHTANTVMGLVFGLLCAVLLAWALSMATAYLVGALGAIDDTRFGPEILEKTVLVRFCTSHNLLAVFRNVIG